MLHLTFNLSCFIACLYAHHPSIVGQQTFVPLLVFLYRARNKNASSWNRLRCWDFFHSEGQLCCRDLPLSDS